jgi:hypothetical protein
MAGEPRDRRNGFTENNQHQSSNQEATTALPAPLVNELSALLTRILVADIEAFPVGALAGRGRAHGTEEQEHDFQ